MSSEDGDGREVSQGASSEGQSSSAIDAEVAYALAHRQTVIPVRLPAGGTVGDAIQASGILERHPEIDLSQQAVGVFGEVATHHTQLHDGDRVEIYRPLLIDPKEARKQRASDHSTGRL